MTRIASFSLYECPRCQQIHIKPEYGSTSTYIPLDLFIKPNDIKICKRCEAKNYFKFVRLESKVNSRLPSRLEMLVRKLLNKPYIEIDVRKLYPKFD